MNTSNTSADRIQVSCPECQRSQPLAQRASWSQIVCESCGHTFNVVDTGQGVSRLREGMAIGRFQLIRPLGAGGFGFVWEAFDPHLERSVALKIPRSEQLSATDAELFLREARSAAQVRHPNIVDIHEVGRDGDYLYLVSEFVIGETLDDWMANRAVPFRQAAEICAAIGLALQTIHESGVIHRDLKPGNVMMDPTATPRLTDFGLARRTSGELTMTVDGQVVGTPTYMSPEQAKGESHRADARSDIYSLGVILYQLLTQTLPFQGSPHQLLHRVIHDPAPSLRRRKRSVPGDLETICMRCLEKSPDKRYQTAADVVNELQRWLDGKPIHARRIGRVRRTLRWARRKPLIATTLLLVTAIAVAGPIWAMRERTLRQRTMEAELTERRLRSEAERSRDEAIDARRRLATAQAATLASERIARHQSYAAHMQLVERALENHDSATARRMLNLQIPQPSQHDFRGMEWYLHWNELQRPFQWQASIGKTAHRIRISPQATSLAVSNEFSQLTMFDAPNRSIRWQVQAPFYRIECCEFDYQENRLLVGGSDGTLVAYDVQNGTEVARVRSAGNAVVSVFRTDSVSTVAAPADEQTKSSAAAWISCTADGILQTWDFELNELRSQQLVNNSLAWQAFSISPEMTRAIGIGHVNALSGSIRHAVVVMIDLVSGNEIWRKTLEGSATSTCFAPDGKTVALTISLGAPKILDAETGETAVRLDARSNSLTWTSFSPDGNQLVAVEQLSSNVLRWELPSGKLVAPSFWHNTVTHGDWCRNGQLVTVGHDGILRTWDSNIVPASDSLGPIAGPVIWNASRDVNGSHIHVDTSWNVQQVWDVAEQRCVHTSPAVEGRCQLMPAGNALIRYSHTHIQLQPFGQLSGQVIYQHDRPGMSINSIAVSNDGQQIAIGEAINRDSNQDNSSDQPGVLLFDRISGATRFLSVRTGMSFTYLAFDRSGRYLYLKESGAKLRKWNLETDQADWEWSNESDGFASRLITATARDRLAIGYANGSVYVLDTKSGKVELQLVHPGTRVNDLAITNDGKTLLVALGNFGVSAHSQGEVRCWDLETGLPLASLANKDGAVVGVALSANSQRLTTVHFQRRIQVWDVGSDRFNASLADEPAR